MSAARSPEPRVLVLGAMRLSDGHQRIPVPAPKVRALLALLAMHPGQVVSADRLIDRLWQGDPPATATAALRVHVTSLRSVLTRHLPGQGLAVTYRAPGYVLTGPGEFVDAAAAEHLLKQAATTHGCRRVALCDQALHLWRGEPYADVALREVVPERARLVELRLDILELRAETRSAMNPPDLPLVAELESLVSAAPLREHLTGLLMLALYRCGREAAALAAFQRLRAHLGDELGLVPSRALQELEGAVLRQAPELDWQAPRLETEPASLTTRSYTDPFVGRRSELASLDRLWNERHRRGALVLGEAGMGKSRLVAEFAARCEANGAVVAVGTCHPDPSIPYRPFIEILRHLRPRDDAVRALLDRLSVLGDTSTPPRGGPDDRLRFFATVCDLLEHVGSSTAGFLMIIEDLHWIDEASAALLRFLCQTDDPLSPLAVVTARSDDPEETVAWSRLRVHLAHPDSPATTILLDALSPAEVAEMAARRGAVGGPGTRGIDALVRLSRGIPLLITELLDQTSGHALDDDGDLTGRVRVPATVAEMVRHRLRMVSAPARRSLDLAAVTGERAPAPIVAAAGRLTLTELYGHRAEAVDVHILTDDDDHPEDLVFKHALIRQAILDAMPPSRRRQLHVQLAEALDADGPDGPDAQIRMARHLLAGVPACPFTTAADATARAAELAIGSFAFESAIDLAEEALAQRTSGDQLPPALTTRLLLALGTALANVGRLGDAAAVFDDNRQQLRTLADRWEPGAFTVEVIGAVTATFGPADRYRSILARAPKPRPSCA